MNGNKPYNVIKMQYELRTGFASHDKNGKTVIYMEEVSDNGQINTGGKSGTERDGAGLPRGTGKGIPPAIIFPICNKCGKRLTKSTTCKVYPNGIPKEILTKKSDCKQFGRE